MASPIAITPELLAVSVGYRNRRLIADDVLRRLSPIKKTTFAYNRQRKADAFTVPETLTGRTSRPNTITFAADRATGETVYHSLETTIPSEDRKAAEQEGQNLLTRRTEYLTRLLMLGRERRVAALAMAAGTYAGNTAALAAGDMFTSGSANPIKTLKNALDAMLVRGNKVVMARDTWNAFSMHPNVVAAALGNSGTAGVATAERIAELLEVDKILIGESRINAAAPGQAPNLVRVWTSGAVALLYDEAEADRNDGMTFGLTVQTEVGGMDGNGRGAGTIFDPHIGPEGGDIIRVWERNSDVITCADAGFLLTGAI